MTSGKSAKKPSSTIRVWATSTLGLPLETSAQQACSGFLRTLEGEGFLPPQEDCEALRIIQQLGAGEKRISQPAALQSFFHRRVMEALRAFAREFFDIPLAERRHRWSELLEQSEDIPAAKARLAALEPGLDTSWPQVTGNEDVDALSRFVCRIFVLDPLQRAAVAREFWPDVIANPAKWKKIGRRFRRECPEVAKLAPLFIDRVISVQRQIQKEKAARNGITLALNRVRSTTSRLRTLSSTWIIVLVLFGAVAARMVINHFDTLPAERSTVTANLEKAPLVPDQQVAELLNAHEESASDGWSSGSVPKTDERWLLYQQEVARIDAAYPDLAGLTELDTVTPDGSLSEREQIERRIGFLEGELERVRLRVRLKLPLESTRTRVGLQIAELLSLRRQLDQLSDGMNRGSESFQPSSGRPSAEPDTGGRIRQ